MAIVTFVLCCAVAVQEPDPRIVWLQVDSNKLLKGALDKLGPDYIQLEAMSRGEFEELRRRANQRSSVQSRAIRCELEAEVEPHRITGTGQLWLDADPSSESMIWWRSDSTAITLGSWSKIEVIPQDVALAPNPILSTIGVPLVLLRPQNQIDALIGRSLPGYQTLLVPRGNRLKLTFQWNTALRQEGGKSRFQIDLPAALRNDIAISTTPREQIVWERPARGPVLGPNNQRIWKLAWAGAMPVRGNLVTPSTRAEFDSLITYGRGLDLAIREQDTSVEAHFQIAVNHRPARQLEFECSAGLQVYEMESTQVKIRDFEQFVDRILVDFDEPIQPGQVVDLDLKAVGQGPRQGVWKQPKLVLMNALWAPTHPRYSQTRITATRLSLFDIRVRSGRLLGPSAVADWVVHQEAADFEIEASVEPHRTEGKLAVHTVVTAEDDLVADFQVSWEFQSNPPTTLRLELPPEWKFTGLVAPSQDNDLVAARQGNLVLLRSRSSLPLQGATTLRARGTDLSGLGSNKLVIPRIGSADFPLTEESGVLRGIGWTARLLESPSVLATAPGTAVAEDDYPILLGWLHLNSMPARIAFVRRRSKSLINVKSTVAFSDHLTTVVHQAEIADWKSPENQLDLAFSSNPGQNLEWKLIPEAIPIRLPGPEGRHWRVFLPANAKPPLTIECRISVPTQELLEIPLLVSEQHAVAGQLLATVQSGLEMIAATTGLVEGMYPAQWSWPSGFQPAQMKFWRYSNLAPTLKVQLATTAGDRGAVISNCSITTTIDRSGTAIHHLRYMLRTSSRCRLDVTPPKNALWIETPPQSSVANGQTSLRIDCAAAVAPYPIDVVFSSRQDAFATIDSWQLILPKINLPVLATSWQVFLPSDYQPLTWEGLRKQPCPTRPWPQKLFGSLADDAGALFSFWKPESWLSLRTPSETPSLERTLPQESSTWGELVDWLSAIETIVVDSERLAVHGVSPFAKLDRPRSGLLSDLLRSSGIRIVRLRDGWLLTDAQLGALEVAGLYESLDEATRFDADRTHRFLSGSLWAQTAQPWIAGYVPPIEKAEGHRFDVTGSSNRLLLTMVRTDLVQALAWVIVVLAGGAGLALKGRNNIPIIIAAGCSAAALTLTLLIDGPLGLLTRACGWGLILFSATLLLRRTLPRPTLSVPAEAASTISYVSKSSARALLLGLGIAATCPGQESDGLYYVIVPTGDSSQVFVPPKLLDQLRASPLQISPLSTALLRSALFQGKWNNERINISIALEVEVPEGLADAKIQLPWTGNRIRLVEKNVDLLPNEQGVAAVLRSPGKNHILLEGLLSVSANKGSVEIPLPEAPLTRWDIEVPNDLEIHFDQASATKVAEGDQTTRYVMELGPVSSLGMRWKPKREQSVTIESDNLSLVRWFDSVSRLEEHIRFRNPTNTSRIEIRWRSPWILESIQGTGVKRYSRGSEPRTLEVDFEAPIDERTALVLKAINPAADRRSLQIPKIQIIGSVLPKRWVSFSGNPGSELALAPAEALEPPGEIDPLEIWPTLSEELSVLHQVRFATVPLRIERTNKPEEQMIQGSYRVNIQPDRVRLDAVLTGTAGEIFRSTLRVPPQMKLDEISVEPDGSWVRLPDNRISWTGRGSEQQTAQIRIRGWIAGRRGQFNVPLVRPVSPSRLSGDLTVNHSRQLTVTEELASELSQVQPAGPEPAQQLRYRIEARNCRLRLRMDPASLAITGSLTHRLAEEGSNIAIDSSLRGDVVEGAFDRIDIQLDNADQFPFQVSSQSHDNISWTVHQDKLVVFFRETVHSSFHLAIQSRLRPDPDGLVEVPRPWIEQASLDEFLVLENSDQVSVKVDSPEQLKSIQIRDPGPARNPDAITYQLAERSPVSVRSIRAESVSRAPVVAWESHKAAIAHPDHLMIESSVYAISAAPRQVELRFPDDSTLHEVWVNSTPRDLKSQRKARILLDARDRIQVIRIWWTRKLSGPRLRIEPISDSPLSVYSLCQPGDFQVRGYPVFRLSGSRLEFLKARTWGALCREHAQIAANRVNPSGLIADLDRHFSRAVTAARRKLQIELPTDEPIGSAPRQQNLTSALMKLVEQHHQFTESIGVRSMLQDEPAVGSEVNQVDGNSWRLFAGRLSGPYVRLRLPAGGIELQLADGPRVFEWSFAVLVAALSGGLIATWAARVRTSNWLGVALVATGLVWLWALRPEIVGVFILVAAITIWVGQRSPWRTTPTRDPTDI